MECGKKISLGPKIIETWEMKTYIDAALELEAEMGNFSLGFVNM